MNTYFLDLFSGIGGFALAAFRAGLRFNGHYFSEIDPYAIELYKKHFPEAEFLGDIQNVDYQRLPQGKWLVTRGFPCQPYSNAGKKKGTSDKRDLWPECSRMLRCLRPSIALFENVRGLLTSPGKKRKGEFFNVVLSDISKCGYDCEWQIISAADAGAPHLRKRVWIVAYPQEQYWPVERQETPVARRASNALANTDDKGLQGRHNEVLQECSGKRSVRTSCSPMANAQIKRCHNWDDGENEKTPDRKINPFADTGLSCGTTSFSNANLTEAPRHRKYSWEIYAESETKKFGERCCKEWWNIEPDVGRVAHGVPFRVDRLKGLGNAIVPQCAEMIFNLSVFDLFRKH